MPTGSDEVCSNSLKLARKYKDERNYARAFPHFLVHFKLKNEQSAGNTRIFVKDHEALSA